MITGKVMNHRGFTLVEMLISIVICLIVLSAVGVVIVDSQKGWNIMYGRLQSDVVTASYIAKSRFDSVIRKASKNNLYVGPEGAWVEVYYYADDESSVLDRYARFYESDGDLNIETGTLVPKVTTDVETICSNVSECVFKEYGYSAQMMLTLDNGSQTVTTVTSAYLHN